MFHFLNTSNIWSCSLVSRLIEMVLCFDFKHFLGKNRTKNYKEFKNLITEIAVLSQNSARFICKICEITRNSFHCWKIFRSHLKNNSSTFLKLKRKTIICILLLTTAVNKIITVPTITIYPKVIWQSFCFSSSRNY